MRYGILEFKDPVPDTSRKILHVDMDAFYANVEARDNPAIAYKPIVIAKHPKLTGGRGIVSTCNYKAREYGIHSAMTAAEAFKRCPHAVFIAGDWSHYQEVSQQIRTIFAQYTDLIEPMSLDEAYLDVTHNKLGIQSATHLAQRIQAQIKAELNLTCSIGVSYNKFLAKIASDYRKPFGITVVTPDQALEFLDDLPIDKFYGVGRQSVPYFHQRGIMTGADLRAIELEDLIEHFGKMGKSLYYKVRGVHDAPVQPHRERKSIGKETTFIQFLAEEEGVLDALTQLTKRVVAILKAKNFHAQTVTLKIRYDDFETLTRQLSLGSPSQDVEVISQAVQELWELHGHLHKSVRLLGVSTAGLIQLDKVNTQLSFEKM